MSDPVLVATRHDREEGSCSVAGCDYGHGPDHIITDEARKWPVFWIGPIRYCPEHLADLMNNLGVYPGNA